MVVGATAYSKLGVDRYPSVDLPTVRVGTRLPGASPAEVESLISHRIEEAVNTVQGVNELRSIWEIRLDGLNDIMNPGENEHE